MDEHARLGKGELFVLEGDEYPSANWDTRSKFLYYRPADVLLTSAAHDHVNVFPTQASFDAPFRELLSLMPAHGVLVACADEENARRIARDSSRPVVFYGLGSQDALWSAKAIEFGERSSFMLTRAGEPVVELSTQLLGRHNVQNIVGAAALLLEKELLDAAAVQAAIASFEGVKRRMELLTRNSRVPVFEGFGSSYDKAISAFSAVRLHFPGRRIVAVFEPHTFSWRSRDKIHWYDDVFAGAGSVLIYQPATQGAETHDQVTHDDIVRRVRKAGVEARAIATPEEALATLDRELRPDDVVLILTSGGLDGMIETIPALAERKFARAATTHSR
jgi:UDP-N-acetylmuramate: L-alanyl-gamma-D-glutamyl-meso-diaminopimelate ligase